MVHCVLRISLIYIFICLHLEINYRSIHSSRILENAVSGKQRTSKKKKKNSRDYIVLLDSDKLAT